MFSKSTSAVLMGIECRMVQVEADVSPGLPYFELVGYLSGEVKEARERVKSSIRNSGFRLDPRRVVINLSPADIRKSGTSYDLAIALSVLCGYGFVERKVLDQYMILGELGLDGEVKSVSGVLCAVMEAKRCGFKRCIVPWSNRFEGAAIEGIEVYGIESLKNAVGFLNNEIMLEPVDPMCMMKQKMKITDRLPDFKDIHGQPLLKRCMEIAAAGMHNLLMIGPPGSGKTLAAKRLPSILPELTYDEQLEVTEIYSAAGLLKDNEGIVCSRPFRSPHHTITDKAMSGGGSMPKPGEISLAHKGVLFLDELTEYNTKTMECLRQPLEEAKITISRIHNRVDFPADFMLVGAMNPCRCGYYPDMTKCNCTPLQIQRYIGRISRPLMDRIDLTVEVKPVQIEDLENNDAEEDSAAIRQRVEIARQIQAKRFEGTGILYNSQISEKEIDKYCALSKDEKQLMDELYRSYGLTLRSYHKILKVARTIADLRGGDRITVDDLTEAAFFKSLDRKYWSK